MTINSRKTARPEIQPFAAIRNSVRKGNHMTTTSTSVDLARNLYAAFAQGDVATILAHVAPDCEWIVAGEGIPAAGNYRGPAGAAQFFKSSAKPKKLPASSRENTSPM